MALMSKLDKEKIMEHEIIRELYKCLDVTIDTLVCNPDAAKAFCTLARFRITQKTTPVLIWSDSEILRYIMNERKSGRL